LRILGQRGRYSTIYDFGPPPFSAFQKKSPIAMHMAASREFPTARPIQASYTSYVPYAPIKSPAASKYQHFQLSASFFDSTMFIPLVAWQPDEACGDVV
jgi:hypothetical protein